MAPCLAHLLMMLMPLEAVNPCVTDKKNYVALDVPEPTLKHIAKNQAG